MPKERYGERISDRLVDADPRSSESCLETGDQKSLALDANGISELLTNHISPRKRSVANLTQQAEGDEGEPSQEDDCDSHKQRRRQSSEDDSAQLESKSDITSTLQHRWDNTFDRLVVFKEKYGHCLVPNRYDEDRSLGAWVSTQRRNYKILQSGKNSNRASSPLTAARVRKLDEIGFVWATSDPRHCPWEVRFEQLRAYTEKFGDALVPIGYTDNIKLANWVSTQRQEYKAFKEGRQTRRMTRERIRKLQSIGMVWDAQRGGNRHHGRYMSMSEHTTNAAAEPPLSMAGDGKRSTPAVGRGLSTRRVHGVASWAIMAAGARDVSAASSSHRETNTAAAPASIPRESSGARRRDSPTSGAILPLRHDGALFALANPLWAAATGSLSQRGSLGNMMNPLAAAAPAAMIEALVARRQEQNALQSHMNRRLTAATIAAAMRNNTASIGGTRATAQSMTMGAADSSLASRLLQHTSELAASAHMHSLSNLPLSVEQYLPSNMPNPRVAGLSTIRDHPSSLLAQYGLGTSPFAPATYSGSLLRQNDSMQLSGAGLGIDGLQGLTSAAVQSPLLQAHFAGRAGHGISSRAQRATAVENASLSAHRAAAAAAAAAAAIVSETIRRELQRRERF